MNLAVGLVVLAVCPGLASGADEGGPPTSEQVRLAIRRGIDFLLKDQNANG